MKKVLASHPLQERDLLYTLSLISSSWQDMYDRIKRKEHLTTFYKAPRNVITVVDKRYPKVFTGIKQPPFSFKYKGDLSLLDNYPLIGVLSPEEDLPDELKKFTLIYKEEDHFVIINKDKQLIITMGIPFENDEAWLRDICYGIAKVIDNPFNDSKEEVALA